MPDLPDHARSTRQFSTFRGPTQADLWRTSSGPRPRLPNSFRILKNQATLSLLYLCRGISTRDNAISSRHTMNIIYDPAAERGTQWSVTVDNGQTLSNTSQAVVRSLLHEHGLSLTKCDQAIAQAKLVASNM